jgi:hypothetical protein
MHNLVLYCKSYIKDLERVIVLAESIKKYNMDNLPFYISVPKEDIAIFQNANIHCTTIICDDIIYECKNKNGWFTQQVIKSSFWKLNICENYLCLDSDSYFIKPFYIYDFIAYNNIPYTVMHEQKELFDWAAHSLKQNLKENFDKEKEFMIKYFNRQSKKKWDFGPTPVIWSCKVWRLLDENYTLPSGLTFEKLIEICPSEFTWYGEALLYFKPFEILPLEPLFKVFHYHSQYLEAKKNNYTEEAYKVNYFGICLQSNFNTNNLKKY